MANVTIVSGANVGRSYEIGDRELVVGRDSICEISLPMRTVSRRHARFGRDKQGFYVEDLGSVNGTFVNGERLVGRHRLHDGDIMRFGGTEVAFRAPREGVDSTVIGRSVARPVLSEAQRRVLISLCRPYREPGAHVTPATNRQIADDLVLSVEAVKTHLRGIYGKLGVGTRREAIAAADKLGLLAPTPAPLRVLRSASAR